MARLCQVHTDLVRAAGYRRRFNQRGFLTRLQNVKSRLGFLAAPGVHSCSPGLARVRSEFEPAHPVLLRGNTVRDGQVNLFHLPHFEQAAVGADRAGILCQQEHTAGVGVQAVKKADVTQVPRPRPVIARFERGHERQLQVAAGPAPRIGREQPSGRLVNGQDGAVFVKNGDDRALWQFDSVRLGHPGDVQGCAGVTSR